MKLFLLCAGFCLLLCLPACQSKEEPEAPTPTAEEARETVEAEPTAEGRPAVEAVPPAPPLFEDFEGKPQLSLFPRAGDYRPEDEDEERLPFWRTFMDHLVKTSKVVAHKDGSNRAFALRSINTIDSVGFFSPLAVEPETSYRVSAKIKAELPEGGEVGIGVLEFDEFLWIGEQFTLSRSEAHQRGAREGLRLTGSLDWGTEEFGFTTGPETRMIHLVLFRDGAHDRKPVLFDDIRIEAAEGEMHDK